MLPERLEQASETIDLHEETSLKETDILVCFLAEDQMTELIPLFYISSKYEATAGGKLCHVVVVICCQRKETNMAFPLLLSLLCPVLFHFSPFSCLPQPFSTLVYIILSPTSRQCSTVLIILLLCILTIHEEAGICTPFTHT